MSLSSETLQLAEAVRLACVELRTKINGNQPTLNELTTTAKGSLVAAINEVREIANEGGGGGGASAWGEITGKPAAVTDLTGTNTGDETTATIKSKLSISTLSGSNTGDQTLPTLSSLGAAPLISPSFTTPALGVASATSVNKLTITSPATSAVLTIADGKTLTASNTLTLTGTDGSMLNIGTGGTLGTAAFTASTAYAPSTGIDPNAITGTAVTLSGAQTISGAISFGGGSSLTISPGSTFLVNGSGATFNVGSGANIVLGDPAAWRTSLAGGTASTGTGGLVRSVDPTITGTLTTAAISATTVTASGNVTFATSVKSTTALATPSALSATEANFYASTISGASIGGYGTTNDVTLRNRAGTVCLGVGPNTTAINIPGDITANSATVTNSVASQVSLTTTTVRGISCLSGSGASVGTQVRVSPSFTVGGHAWNTTSGATRFNEAQMYVLPTAGSTTSGTLIFGTRQIDSVVTVNTLFSVGFDGAFSIPGTLAVTQAATISGVINANKGIIFPTSATGLASGSWWNNAGVLTIVP